MNVSGMLLPGLSSTLYGLECIWNAAPRVILQVGWSSMYPECCSLGYPPGRMVLNVSEMVLLGLSST